MLPLWVTWLWTIIKELRSHKLHCVAKNMNKYRKRKGREVILPQIPPAEPRRQMNRIFRLLKLDLPSSLLSSAETHYTDTCIHSLDHLSPCPYSQLSSLLQLPKSHQRTLNSLQTSTPTSASVAPCHLCPSDPLMHSTAVTQWPPVVVTPDGVSAGVPRPHVCSHVLDFQLVHLHVPTASPLQVHHICQPLALACLQSLQALPASPCPHGLPCEPHSGWHLAVFHLSARSVPSPSWLALQLFALQLSCLLGWDSCRCCHKMPFSSIVHCIFLRRYHPLFYSLVILNEHYFPPIDYQCLYLRGRSIFLILKIE